MKNLNDKLPKSLSEMPEVMQKVLPDIDDMNRAIILMAFGFPYLETSLAYDRKCPTFLKREISPIS